MAVFFNLRGEVEEGRTVTTEIDTAHPGILLSQKSELLSKVFVPSGKIIPVLASPSWDQQSWEL